MNAYLDNEAISVGYAIQKGIVLKKENNYWKEINTNDFKDSSLITRNKENIVPIGTNLKEYYSQRDCINGWQKTKAKTGEYFFEAKIQNCIKSTNNLYYGNDCRSGYKFTKGPSAVSYCHSKGMRLPTRVEAVGFIPSCGDWTWTNDATSQYDSWTWHGSNTYHEGSSNGRHFVRCVK